MTSSEYRQQDALGLADLVRKGAVTPLELLDAAIAEAEVQNPAINAIVTPLYEQGRRMLDQLPDGQAGAAMPFRGVPFLLKDLGLEWAGTPLKSGCRGYAGYVSSEDSFDVARYKQAGLIFFGKTNTPEFGLTPYTESQLYGPARNPWNLAHSPGGSSGGAAAAVAAGIVPAASASDGGGSIRIPSSCCGLFGMIPSRGRASLGPRFGEMWQGAVRNHVISRTVRDSAAFLDVIAGTSPGDPYTMGMPSESFLSQVGKQPGKLRIAFTAQNPFPTHQTHAECVAAVHKTAKLLESLGHTVEEVALPYDHTVLSEMYLTMVLGETGATIRELSEYLKRPARRDDMEMNTWALSRISEAYSAADFSYQNRRWNLLARRMGQLHETYDLLLMPTLSRPPIRIGELQNTSSENQLMKVVDAVGGLKLLKGSKQIDQLAEKAFGYIPFPPIANMTGQPSMSVPLHMSADGLPIGSMLTAALGNEALLFQIAAQLEQAQPWAENRPGTLA
ncbi:amidase [Fibrella aquatica]|uniref:amidase n=1 Tax=Fibrella aquatica TaxID=3242487 RepID=UPI0035213DAC